MSGIKNSWKYEKDLFVDYIKNKNYQMNNYLTNYSILDRWGYFYNKKVEITSTFFELFEL